MMSHEGNHAVGPESCQVNGVQALENLSDGGAALDQRCAENKMDDPVLGEGEELACGGMTVLDALRQFSEEQQRFLSMTMMDNWNHRFSEADLKAYMRLPSDQQMVMIRTGLKNLNALLKHCTGSGCYVIGVNLIGEITVASSDDIFSDEGRS